MVKFKVKLRTRVRLATSQALWRTGFILVRAGNRLLGGRV